MSFSPTELMGAPAKAGAHRRRAKDARFASVLTKI